MRVASSCRRDLRPALDGKFLQAYGRRFLVRGVSYGTFAPGADGAQYPERATVARDFGSMRAAGINTVRVYTPPPRALLDLAAEHDLRLIIGLPWAQHIAFLDERGMRRTIRRDLAAHARAYAAHPATLLLALGNEIHPSVVRWHGIRAVERFLRELYDAAKTAAPDALFTYVNYPPTEYLDVSCFDVCAFNVYLHDEDRLRAYLARLHHIAGCKPLLIAEAGADSIRHGEEGQAALTAMQARTAFGEGACGVVAFAWTDEWWRGGAAVDDWAFGLVDRDRRAKPALRALSDVFRAGIDQRAARMPRVSVVVCAYNAEATIDECLRSLAALVYPDFEIIVVDDGSTDRTAQRAGRYPFVRLVRVPQGGLSNARNVGLDAATGSIVAYCDADVRVDPQWLEFLVRPFDDPRVMGAGGPNLVPPDDPWMAQCVARAPGAPTHVLLDDKTAEHVPGCNMAFRREALLKVRGFNPIFLRAGDDVDLCWRVQSECGRIGFAPAALVWHRHRASVRAYWRQQVGYGEGEAWLQPLHPDKFIGRRILWRGLVYSPLPFVRSLFGRRINGGVWGSAPFPSVYRVGAHPLTYVPHSADWQMGSFALILTGLALLAWNSSAALTLLAAGTIGAAITVWKCIEYACASDIGSLGTLPRLAGPTSRLVYRLVIASLHFIQPLARLSGRIRGLLNRPVAAPMRQPTDGRLRIPFRQLWDGVRLVAGRPIELKFWGESWADNAALLTRVVTRLRELRVAPRIDVDDGWWTDRDISVGISPLARLDLQSLVEDHGTGRCLFRANVRLHRRPLNIVLSWATLAIAGSWLAGAIGAGAALAATAMLCGVTGAVVAQVARGSVVMRDAIRGVAAQFQLQAITPRPRDMARIAYVDAMFTHNGLRRRSRRLPSRPAVVSPAVAQRLAARPAVRDHR